HWWSYTAHVPDSYDGNHTLPLVIALHGSGGSAEDGLERMGWAAMADREGFLAVAPDALPVEPTRAPEFLRNPRVWNSGRHPPDRPRCQIDDIEFFDNLLDDVE